MTGVTDYRDALWIDRFVGTFLEQYPILAPPIDAVWLANQLRISVVYDQRQPGRGRFQRISGQPTMFLKPEPRNERTQWAAAHELGEALAAQACRYSEEEGAFSTSPGRENWANAFASCLLLPYDWFCAASTACGHDLRTLKQHFPTASHQLIAQRWLQVLPAAVVTIWDREYPLEGPIPRNTRVQRQSNLNHPLNWLDLEHTLWEQARRQREPATLAGDGWIGRIWPIDELPWQRDILLLTPDPFRHPDEDQHHTGRRMLAAEYSYHCPN